MIPTPKALKTRFGNDTCRLAITYNPMRKATKMTILRIVNNIKQDLHFHNLIFLIPISILRILEKLIIFKSILQENLKIKMTLYSDNSEMR